MLAPDAPRNVRRLVVAHAVSRAGGTAAFFVGLWGLSAYELGATPGQLALLTAGIGATALVGSAVSGVLVDRVGPKRVLVGGEALFVPAILLLTTADSMVELTVTAIPAWFLLAFVQNALASMPPFLTDDPRTLERVNGAVEVGGNVAFVAGPALGAFVAGLVSIDAIFVVDAATSLVAVALVARLAVRPVAGRAGAGSGVAEFVDGFRYAFGHPPVRFVLLIGTVTFLSFGAFTALEPLFFRDVVGAPVETLGWVNTVFGAGLVAGAAVVGRAAGRLLTMRALAVLTAAGGLGAVGYTSTGDLRVILVAAVGWGTVLGVLLPLLRTLLQLHTREGYVGRVMGAFGVQHQVGEMLPLAVLPAVAAALGVQPTLVATGVLLVVLAVAAFPRARALDLRLAAPEGALDLDLGDDALRVRTGLPVAEGVAPFGVGDGLPVVTEDRPALEGGPAAAVDL